jgi:von Willebrand factor type A domain/Aerotolerance regulator N-terminal
VTFLTALALAAAILVVAPYLAHRLRRRKAEEQPFPPTHLVAPALPKARRRSRLEDRALFATRASAVVVLAVLGATPLVRCSRLSLQRSGGASVAMAIVIDDSMSMRAPLRGGQSRFDRALQGARELLASAREGDAVAVVLSGAPARVALAATTDLGAVRHAIDSLAQSDRATDLDGALGLAQSLISPLPQIDRRLVILSDLADGLADAAPLGDSSALSIWVALPELRAEGSDCALTRADRRGIRVRVQVRCGPGASALGREVIVEDARGSALGHASVATGASARGNATANPGANAATTANAAANVDLTILLPSDEASPATARLSGTDAILADDVAPVVAESGRAAIAVVADEASEAVATGGAPVAEQALSALKLDVDVRPLPAFPDRVEDLAGSLGVLLDDPPGLTPEQRHALVAYFDGGGELLLALGPCAAAAPLGASLEPVLSQAISWSETKSVGADPVSASGELAESVRSLLDLEASHRSLIAPIDRGAFESIVAWTDGAPLVARRAIGRGDAWIVTLPISLEASDLALRPAFLALLGAWEHAARERTTAQRSEVGSLWTFPGARTVEAEGPSGPIASTRDERGVRLVPPLIGRYHVVVDGKAEVRVAMPVTRELDLRPRSAASKTGGEGLGQRRASVDVSGHLALALLAVTAFEMGLRMWLRQRKA